MWTIAIDDPNCAPYGQDVIQYEGDALRRQFSQGTAGCEAEICAQDVVDLELDALTKAGFTIRF